jgi:hypothetical protein
MSMAKISASPGVFAAYLILYGKQDVSEISRSVWRLNAPFPRSDSNRVAGWNFRRQFHIEISNAEQPSENLSTFGRSEHGFNRQFDQKHIRIGQIG